jgi:hypothetical protein
MVLLFFVLVVVAVEQGIQVAEKLEAMEETAVVEMEKEEVI